MMKIALLLIAAAFPLLSQNPPANPPVTYSDPTGQACQANQVAVFAPTGKWFTCQSGIYAASGGGGASTYCAPASASGAAYICTPSPAITSYTTGLLVSFVPDVNGSGGATTLAISGLAAKSVKRSDCSTNPLSTDFVAGTVSSLVYNGTVLCEGPTGPAGAAGAAGPTSSATPTGPTRYTVNIGQPSAVATWVVNAITPTFVTVPTVAVTGDLNDLTVGAGYTGATATYCILITAAGTPDVFSWGTAGSCSNGATGVSITGASQTLSNGFAITFGATTGHALTKWTIVATVGSAVATAATTQNINLFTMPARAKMIGVTLKQSSPFTGIANENGTNGLIMSVGWSTANAFYYGAGNSPITAGCDLGQAVSNTQQCDIGGWVSPTFASHTVTVTVQSSCSSGSCFLSGLSSTSSVDIWPNVAVLP